jgi:hypothetical protein
MIMNDMLFNVNYYTNAIILNEKYTAMYKKGSEREMFDPPLHTQVPNSYTYSNYFKAFVHVQTKMKLLTSTQGQTGILSTCKPGTNSLHQIWA